MADSRKKKSLRNIIVALFSNLLIYILSLFTSKVVKENLGLQVMGLNGVLSNVISILSLSEMGIASAICFALYKPLAEDNKDLIKAIMNFYKKAYNIVALIIFVLGLILLFFIPNLITDSSFSKSYIYAVYLLFLSNSVISYICIYKRTLIVADQKNYVLSTISLIYVYVLRISQLLAVYFTSNYILFLIIQIICQILYNTAVNIACNKLYPYIKEPANPLPAEIKNTIFVKIKALFWHSLGTVIVYGTDNLLISYFCGISEAGRYTSYLSIVAMITTLIVLVFDNLKDSVGNFLVTESTNEQYKLFNRLFFLNQSLVSICSICLIILLTPFIKIWLGEDTILPSLTVLCMIISFYLSKNNLTIGNIKNAAGMFEQDKFVPIIESIINLVVSIILAKFFGIIGIILGTICSTFLCPFWIQPTIVFKNLFGKNPLIYFVKYLSYLIRTVIIYLIAYYIHNVLIKFEASNFFIFLVDAFVTFAAVSIMWIVSLFWKEETKYFFKLFFSKLKRK